MLRFAAGILVLMFLVLAGQAADPDPVAALIEQMKDKNSAVRINAVRQLHQMEDREKAKPAIPQLMATAQNDDREEIRVYAAATLTQIDPGNREAINVSLAPLMLGLKNDDENFRIMSANALASIGPQAREAVPLLRDALKDGDLSSRFMAARALTVIDPGNAESQAAIIPIFIESLKHKDAMYRANAGFLLSQIGPSARDAVPALNEALKDEAEPVRRMASFALEKIGAK